MSTTEPHPIRNAIEQSDTVTAHKNIAATADREIKAHQQTREAANAAVKQIQGDWVKLLEDLESLKQSLADAREALEFGQKESDLKKNQYFNWVSAVSNLQYLDGAKNIVALLAAVPILKERVAYKEKLLTEHVKKMRAFGRAHGIEQETLNQLSGSVS